MKKLILLLLPLLFSAYSLAMPKVEFRDLKIEGQQQLVLFVADVTQLRGSAAQVDKLTEGRLSKAIKASGLKNDFGQHKTFYGLSPFSQITVVSGTDKLLSQAELQQLGGYAVSNFPANGQQAIALFSDDIKTDVAAPEAYIAMGAGMRDYHFDTYKKADAKTSPRWLILNAADNTAATLYQNDLRYVVEGIYLARDLASEPGKNIYPQTFVERVTAKFSGLKNVKVTVLNVKDMQKHNMGALMGVGLGSVHEPKLLVIEYNGTSKNTPPTALVGKGITFDTGGISIKPNDGMWAMKSDLSGAAAVAGTMLAVASRGENVNLVGLMPLAENMPAGNAIRPGDVLSTMQGTTIEIISTDAEGRLILADAVRYAQQQYKPGMLLNIATLTGSAARALSDEYAALITRDWDLSVKMMAVGKLSGEEVWPLPLHPNHFKQIKSEIADIKNSGAGNPGASIGAAVVATFVDEQLPWVHLDIAGVDWLDADIAVAPKGSQGWGVRFMDQLVRQQAKQL
ncbi:leucyl aminopeptidase family protein [Arsukibacterium perlucidum]|uniref:leucyl aminopeptidase family protein n=1 Tax=Arsukibacterium perlucidum TaxID=368811 RepID=UPI00037B7139|nr:leucyl aminopeptidase family protein [Arsukibacterium perlucidum]